MHWQPSASLQTLRNRSLLIQKIRQFFMERKYLEVETPIVSHYGSTDINIFSLKATCFGKTCYLHTSPEFFMKRLLASGSGPIFQIAKVFRDSEQCRWHNPEFTLLEWYKLEVSHHELLKEVDQFLQHILGCEPLVKRSYQEVFATYCNINPHTAPLDDLKNVAKKHKLADVLLDDDMDSYLYLLMSHVIEPILAKELTPTAVYDFPITQSSLARIINNRAARFEVYFKGVELANGFYELTDVEEQSQRFATEKTTREKKGIDCPPLDPFFLRALKEGLPNCSGVALGVDRLIALALNETTISNVLSFYFDRV